MDSTPHTISTPSSIAGRDGSAARHEILSRSVVGWANSTTNDTALALAALNVAAQHCQAKLGLIEHAGRGSQFAIADHGQRLTVMGAIQGMSRKVSSYDNTVSKSVIDFLKSIVYERFEHQSDAQRRRLDTTEVFYSGARRQSAVGHQNPRGVERLSL